MTGKKKKKNENKIYLKTDLREKKNAFMLTILWYLTDLLTD